MKGLSKMSRLRISEEAIYKIWYDNIMAFEPNHEIEEPVFRSEYDRERYPKTFLEAKDEPAARMLCEFIEKLAKQFNDMLESLEVK